MSKVTRRSVPALLASAACLVSTALTAGPSVDPVYAAIAAAEAANGDYNASLKALAVAERRLWKAQGKLSAPVHAGVTLRSPEDVDSHLNRLYLRPSIRAAFAKRLAQGASPEVASLATKFEPSAIALEQMREHDALRDSLHVAVARYEADCEDLRRTSGLEAAETHADRCGAHRVRLLEAAIATAPTTQAGASALAAFALKHAAELGEDEIAVSALATLAAFLSRNV